MNPFSLAGKTAVVTGGATGLGLAMTECLVEAGARVAVVSRNKTHFEQNCTSFGENVCFFSGDVADTDSVPALAAQILQTVGTVDILINNAGNHCKKPIEHMETAEFSKVLQTHLVGAFALTRALLAPMRAQKSGSILFLASMTSYIGQPAVMGYAAAKAGVLGMVHTLSAEVASEGVRVNAIAPGWIDTPMYRQATNADPERRAKILGRIQTGQVGTPRDIGLAAVYLCSDAARYVTGTCLPVDGGALIGF